MKYDIEKALKIAESCASSEVVITEEATKIIDSWKDPRLEALKEVKEATPREFSILEICGIDEDNEDWAIYERRCYESERRMGKEYR